MNRDLYLPTCTCAMCGYNYAGYGWLMRYAFLKIG